MILLLSPMALLTALMQPQPRMPAQAPSPGEQVVHLVAPLHLTATPIGQHQPRLDRSLHTPQRQPDCALAGWQIPLAVIVEPAPRRKGRGSAKPH